MFIERLKIDKEKIKRFLPSLVLAVVMVLGFHFLGNLFTQFLWLISILLVVVTLMLLMFVAGFAVIQALGFVSAELSLLIYLAQSYCALPSHPAQGNNALFILVVVGMAYIVFSFVKSLWKILSDTYKKVECEPWRWEKIVAVSLYLSFTYMVISQIVQIVFPILQNLCIYHSHL